MWLLGVDVSAVAQPDDYNFDFVTITHPGNPGYDRRPDQFHLGRGSVNYEYRIARSEISTSQWMEFGNALATRGQGWAALIAPSRWGAVFFQPGGVDTLQFQLNPFLSDAGQVPVGGISFTQAAMYSNWLHNGKRVDDASLSTGAYQIDALGSGSPFMTNFERLPGARYWVPTLDEWMKAVYWDPDNPAEGGWWEFPDSSDSSPIAGPPGIGETNAGYLDTRDDWTDFRLNQYPDTQTPWGLLDATGGAGEMTSTLANFGPSVIGKGAPLGDEAFDGAFFDRADVAREVSINSGSAAYGLRIASAVPSPMAVAPFVFASCFIGLRRRSI